MKPGINNMTLNEYLMYEGQHRELEKGYTSRISVAPQRNRILVYPDSDEEDENHNEVDIDNMTVEEYVEDVEMDEDYDIDHSNTKEALQWSPVKDPFLVVMELDDQSSFLLYTIPSSISNEVKRELKTAHRFSQQGNRIRDHINSDSCGKNVSVWA
ncbi:hypothetical protein Tco_0730086 [Tanacetum coccineum]|uniref:Uncharacterized protein n=1 Tax=Tanacetum coccineum TaxID=301880 RepID=A0ABQ4YR72_9ASTR